MEEWIFFFPLALAVTVIRILISKAMRREEIHGEKHMKDSPEQGKQRGIRGSVAVCLLQQQLQGHARVYSTNTALSFRPLTTSGFWAIRKHFYQLSLRARQGFWSTPTRSCSTAGLILAFWSALQDSELRTQAAKTKLSMIQTATIQLLCQLILQLCINVWYQHLKISIWFS